jgi:hypothetical protein
MEVAEMEEDATEEVIDDKEVSDEDTIDTTEENSETMEDESEEKESVSETNKDEEEKTEPDSKESEDTDVQTEDSKESKIVRQEAVQGEKSIDVDVEEVKVTSVEEVTIFSNQDSLDTYSEVVFYNAENIYVDVDNTFFQQLDLSEYNQQIYEGVSLASYIENDIMEVKKKKLEELRRNKNKILLELNQLRN